MKKYFANLKHDLPASIIVFLVAVPLCLGIALASGAPLFSGIIAGIVGGIIVGALSGSQLGVSGPAAGLAVIVLTAIQDLGSFETFLLAVVISGVIQFILGVLRAGIIGYYFPSSVIKGMLAGIGIIIFIKQIPLAFGASSAALAETGNILSYIQTLFTTATTSSLIISLSAVALLILWERPFMKKIKIFNFIQGPLVVVAIGIILFNIFKGTDLALAESQVVTIPVADSISGFFNQFTFPDFTQWNNVQVYTVAFTLAIVASLETLLCLEATDKLDPMKRVTPANQELRAQGIGNLVSGLIGGLPVTQVIVRSSTNIMSGGRTKVSAIMHGVILLGSAMLIPNLLNMIPLASLAAILFIVGYKLAKPSLFKAMYKTGRANFLPFIITILAIVFTDLLVGIGIGMAVAVFYILFNNYKKPFLFEKEKHVDAEGNIVIELSEDVTFLNKANIQRALTLIPDNNKVVIDASKSVHIHNDVIEIIEEFEVNAKERGIEVKIIERRHKEMVPPPVETLERSVEQFRASA